METLTHPTALKLDSTYVLNHCTKYIARDRLPPRHNFGQFENDAPQSGIAESWRFPIVDTYKSTLGLAPPQVEDSSFNKVTFVYCHPERPEPKSVEILGTFHTLYESLPLEPVMWGGEPTRYWALSLAVPKARLYRYLFMVDGVHQLDNLNPQTRTDECGSMWSEFFTELCTRPIVLEQWEMALVARFVQHILPFRTTDGERFLKYYYHYLDRQEKQDKYAHAYRLDQPVGVTNFIDKLLARQEAHRRKDYKICLDQLRRILQQRFPYIEWEKIPKEGFVELYEQMGQNNVPGWDTSLYASPQYFLNLLRRHTYTGAFSHPKHGGNVAGAGWAYLARFETQEHETAFDWARSIEKPLGSDPDYFG